MWFLIIYYCFRIYYVQENLTYFSPLYVLLTEFVLKLKQTNNKQIVCVCMCGCMCVRVWCENTHGSCSVLLHVGLIRHLKHLLVFIKILFFHVYGMCTQLVSQLHATAWVWGWRVTFMHSFFPCWRQQLLFLLSTLSDPASLLPMELFHTFLKWR